MRVHPGIEQPGAAQDEPVAIVGARLPLPWCRPLPHLALAVVDGAPGHGAGGARRAVGAGGAGRFPDQVAARLRYGCFLDDVYAHEPEFTGINAQEAPLRPVTRAGGRASRCGAGRHLAVVSNRPFPPPVSPDAR